MTTTAQIAAKGCNNTGITEEIAKTLHDNLGRTIVAIVELTADARSENRDGDEKVKLTIGTVEVAPAGMAADHVRELARSFHYERQLADGQLQIETGDDLEPKVADVLAAGARHKPHPFLPVDAADDNPLCDVCGVVENASTLHADRSALDDPFTTSTADDTDDEPDAA